MLDMPVIKTGITAFWIWGVTRFKVTLILNRVRDVFEVDLPRHFFEERASAAETAQTMGAQMRRSTAKKRKSGQPNIAVWKKHGQYRSLGFEEYNHDRPYVRSSQSHSARRLLGFQNVC